MKLTLVIPLSFAVIASASATPIQLVNSYSQNFDTLASSGTSSTLPAGWEFFEGGTGGDTTYSASSGTSTTGNTYSFGASGSSERALGTLQSGTVIPIIGVQFQNATAGNFTSLNIAYTGEQWRLASLSRVDQLDFQYSLDATSLTTGTWLDANALDFVAPNTSLTTGQLDGNDAANRVSLSSTLTGLTIAPDQIFWLRWTDLNASGADDGLGIDDFSITIPSGATASVPDALPLGYGISALLGVLAFRRGRIHA